GPPSAASFAREGGMNNGDDETDQQINWKFNSARAAVERQPAQAPFDGALGLPGWRGCAHLQAVPRGDDLRQGRHEGLATCVRAAHRALHRAADGLHGRRRYADPGRAELPDLAIGHPLRRATGSDLYGPNTAPADDRQWPQPARR